MFQHNKCKCCAAMWWSGFFGLAMIGHMIRLIARAHMQVGTHVIPMGVSVLIAIIAGALSFIFCKTAEELQPSRELLRSRAGGVHEIRLQLPHRLLQMNAGKEGPNRLGPDAGVKDVAVLQ